MAELEQSLEELKVVKQAFKDNINANDVSTANVEFRNMPALLKQMEKKLPAQTKNVNPTTSEQTIIADSGYKLAQVNIKAVKPSDYYKPEQSLSVTPKTTSQTLTPSGNSVYNQVNVSAVTSAIDGNIIPTNIRKGTTILGVQGNLEADKPDQQKTVNPTTSQQFVVADNGYELAKVTVNAVTSSIDSNIQAGNIKKGTTILGVTGTLESTGTATVTLQEKSINPTTTRQSVTPDSGYDGLSKVNVEAVVPSQYYKPEEVANVAPMETTQVITPSSGAVFSSVNVQAVSSDYVGSTVQRLGANTYVPSTTDAVINAGQYLNGTQIIKGDANLVADNIKEGVSLFGVVGTHKGGAVGDDSKFSQLVDGTITNVGTSDLSGVNTIRNNAFNGLSIENVDIPSNVTTIGDGAFANNNISALNMNEGVTTIGNSAFQNNSISTLTIPASVTTIGASAFAGNTLTEITMEGDTPPVVTDTTFPSSLTTTNVSYSGYPNYAGDANWQTYKDTLVRGLAIPSTITVIVNNYLNELVNGAAVTIEGNGQTYTGTTNENGVFTQGDLQPATYTVSVADLDGFKTPDASEVIVEEDTNNAVTITYLEKSSLVLFSEATPEQISAVSAEISANNMTSQQVYETYGWNLGDTKDITLSTGEVIQMQIIGFNHDDKSDGSGKAGITLQTKNCLNTKYKMNDTKTNAGGYPASLMKTTTLPSIKSTLPQEWQDVIKLVDKKSANGGKTNYSKTVTTSEDLFLLAMNEASTDINTYAQDEQNEGSIYEFCKENFNTYRAKTANGTLTDWWTRSCFYAYTDYFCLIPHTGTNNNGATATFSRGVSFAFCV